MCRAIDGTLREHPYVLRRSCVNECCYGDINWCGFTASGCAGVMHANAVAYVVWQSGVASVTRQASCIAIVSRSNLNLNVILLYGA